MKAARIIATLAITIGVALAASLPASAEDTKYGGGSTQAYSADAPIQVGTIVVLTGKDANRVKVATQKEVQNMFGVVVDKNQLPLTISGGSAKQNETFVAVSGTYNVLVTNQEGPIAAGDYLTLSSVDGLAMRAGEENVVVFGRANSPFTENSVSLGETSLKDSMGGSKKVKIGSIPVTIDIKNNPNHQSTEADLPDILRRVGQQIAEKEVNPVRIYLSLGITIITLIAAMVVIYAGIRNSVISIGRNPMTKKSIFRALVEVILTALLILIIGLFAVYLLLKL